MFEFSDYLQNIFQLNVKKNENEHGDNLIEVNSIHIPTFDKIHSDVLFEYLEAIIFERLSASKQELKDNLTKFKINKNNVVSNFEFKIELNPLIYLFQCYKNFKLINFSDNNLKELIKKAILNQTSKCLTNFYANKRIDEPFLLKLVENYYFQQDDTDLKEFLSVIGEDEDCDEETLVEILKEAYYNELCLKFRSIDFFDVQYFTRINYIKLFTINSRLSSAFIKLNSPWYLNSKFDFDKSFTDNYFDSKFSKSLIGIVLGSSCLPTAAYPKDKYFVNPMRNTSEENANLEKNIGNIIKNIAAEFHEIFINMLKQDKDLKEELLNYFGLVLYCFKNRSQLWVNELSNLNHLTDGFMLNFLHVLLLLCKPFAKEYSDKLLKIDSRYCAIKPLALKEVNSNEMEKIHLRGLDQDSFLINVEEPDTTIQLNDSKNYNFMTEIFFMAHKAIQLGFKPCYDRFLRIATNLAEISRARLNNNSENVDQIMLNNEMDRLLTKYYSIKSVICQDDFLELFIKFNLATATWLCNLSMFAEHDVTNINELKNFLPLKLNLEDNSNESKSSNLLRYVPEFICENVAESFIFAQRFADNNLSICSIKFDSLISFILAFIASPNKMKNPHLRAKLAEVLEELRPKSNQPSFRMNAIEFYSDIFLTYQYKEYLIPALIHVFVSIELTGQSVAFEQKFQYRRSIYAVLEYLWNETTVNEIYRSSMVQLSNNAIRNIENPNAPLFLRFINLMTNDAIFVLDEALENMSKLRKLQTEKASGSWSSLNLTERREKEHSLKITERMAKWSNMMGLTIITMLFYLSSEIKEIFCHPIFVDRLVSMLNYFLMHLVGPKREQFKVKSANEFLFNPAEIVLNICKIYVNLGYHENNKNWQRFCRAVINDTRSYSPDLLPAAVKVLQKTRENEVFLIEQIIQVDNVIKKLIEQVKKQEINVNDIPEEFLDPIMSTLMKEPVKLPSGHILDKSTIARHLLSDQTDPFTRKPLTMEMLIPETELKNKISQFVAEYNSKKNDQ